MCYGLAGGNWMQQLLLESNNRCINWSSAAPQARRIATGKHHDALHAFAHSSQ
jgi:hypothetical protein